MNILIIDGMGGGIGKAVVDRIRSASSDYHILAIGTNAIAASAMRKAGADQVATGENAIVYNSSHVDCIIGSIGIILANAMLGEISPRMAEAVILSNAAKILIPTSKCNVTVLGVREQPIAQYIDEIPAILQKLDKRDIFQITS
ncbi:MAG: DUF3842 family protein [Clostridiales bacterium]|jgi:hypothetical protein|nr:DUF3842 family protein [Clostridiales bacterium]